MARGLMVSGLILLLIGAAWHLAPGWFGWVGKLPGDLRIQRGRTGRSVPGRTRAGSSDGEPQRQCHHFRFHPMDSCLLAGLRAEALKVFREASGRRTG